MKSNRLNVLITGLLVVVLLCVTFLGGFVLGRVNPAEASAFVQGLSAQTQSLASNVIPGSGSQPVDRNTLFKPFWQVWDLVHTSYVDQPVDDTALMRGAISGMLKALGDEHTSYMDPDLTKKFEAQLNGQTYEGIGAWVDARGEFLKIISPMPDSPAEKAGLKPGDLIIAVDGQDMTGIDGELVRQKVIGPEGTQVKLTIQRNGVEKPFDVTVTRASIVTPTIETRMLDNQIAYVHLLTFGDNTGDDLRKALSSLMAQNPKGLILDLRYNGGGYLNTAIDVASEFIPDGVIVYEQYADGSKRTFNANPGGLATKIPMAVLVNEGSASASEIVSGAIQDRGRGKLVGVTTYGKGSVQIVQSLVNNQGEVRITTAHWLTPNERMIDKKGLTPDIEVKITDADVQASKDPQLDAAVNLLLGK